MPTRIQLSKKKVAKVLEVSIDDLLK